ncbi:hypothetical protein NMG60_11034767 [Bertholletia excelsa]
METETELRLGLPGGGCSGGGGEGEGMNKCNNSNGKRGFEETVHVDLKLNLCTCKETTAAILPTQNHKSNNDPVNKPPAKAQVVGWPPVRSYRKNIMAVQRNNVEDREKTSGGNGGAYVKVSVDGAPYLRKVDLKLYKSYQQLSDALANMFSSFTINGNCGSQGLKDFMNESKLVDILSGSDYVPTYEDKDGDWMLVGDVPWEMFVDSCKRLRIMKGKEAIGLAPRAMEKCKNRS